jgi:hypothetical protein
MPLLFQPYGKNLVNPKDQEDILFNLDMLILILKETKEATEND